MSYEINEVVIIDGSRNIVNAGVGIIELLLVATSVGTSGHPSPMLKVKQLVC